MTDKELLKECKNFIDNYAMWEERDYDGFDLSNKIKNQLTLTDVGCSSCDCKQHSVKTSYGFEICTKCGNEWDV